MELKKLIHALDVLEVVGTDDVKIAGIQSDSRKVEDLWLIDALAEPRPRLKTYKAELAGDKNVIQFELLIGDADTREVKKINIDRWKDQYVDILYASNDAKRLYSTLQEDVG